ncbi:uncharacterized protein LOC128232002 [Mya arenaria]|uniref:uncharacterized protein LOC128232002 n=1 Tax=Mya arenaria TaxID=6604 RepID=UPI0022E52EDC|nr:uncharacterized protein LOC128232002 [Mya arenaria]
MVDGAKLQILLFSVCCLSVFVKGTKDDPIKDVHIIYMNHLDVGYNGISPKIGFINNVINAYFTEHFPRALNLSDELKQGGYVETFIYTTHPWLLSLYINCPYNSSLNGIMLKCPSNDDKLRMLKAIKLGDVSYHAGPMNMQPENMNQLLFELSLNISTSIDNYMGLQREYRTLSQRDVPGMTIAVIPTLVKKNIKAVSVGVNDGTSPPAVPKIFTWKFDDENSVIAMWHKGGYPDNPGPSPSNPGGLSRDGCVTFEGFDTALCFAFRTDNSGPPESVEEILGYYEILRAEFPGANLHASTFEKFVEAVWPMRDQLPVVTNEIGDTWIQGISSDPRKLAEYRVVMNALTNCIKEGKCDVNDPQVTESIFNLVKLGEHTWGLPGVYDTVNWTNHDFYRARSGDNYKNCTQAWVEQRVYTQRAVESLRSLPVVAEIKKELKEIKQNAMRPNLEGFDAVEPTSMYKAQDGMEIVFGETGAIIHLYDPYNKENWAKSMSFGRFLYHTYDESDFNRSHSMYPYKWPTFYQKPNLTRNGDAVSKLWDTQLMELFKWRGNDFVLIAKIVVSDDAPHLEFGAPSEVWITYAYNPTVDTPGFDITMQWYEKTSTRNPESLMYYFSPLPPPPVSEALKFQPRLATPVYKWKLRKLGQIVYPDNVVLNGSQYLHAVDSDVLYTTDSGAGLQVAARDTPLVSLGTVSNIPSPFPIPLAPIQQGEITGFAFNLYNNMWDTNYILWYPYIQEDENFKARFQVNFLTDK